MKHDDDAKRAAESLGKLLRVQPWFVAVGVGVFAEKPAIYLYTKKRASGFAFPMWHEGFLVVLKKSGAATPAEQPGLVR